MPASNFNLLIAIKQEIIPTRTLPYSEYSLPYLLSQMQDCIFL